LRREDPWPVLPRRVVADVLRVSAFEISNPVALSILVEADDLSRCSVTHFVNRNRFRGVTGSR